MKVRMLDPSRLHEPIRDELKDAVESVLDSGTYILGDNVEALELACCEALEVDYSVAVSSGTDALMLSLLGLDIGPGDEVLVPSFTFFATAEAVSRVGAVPVFVDIDPKSYTISVSDALVKLTSRTKAIIPVHLFGQAANMTDIMSFASKHSLFVIEDACQAIMARDEGGRYVGSIGDCGCFSFFPSKNLGGFGDGGLITTNNKDLAEKIRLLRVHGSDKHSKYVHRYIGGNFRLDEIQAALLLVKLRYLRQYTLQRREHASIYMESLRSSGHYVLPTDLYGSHVYNQFTIRTNLNRDRLRNFLHQKGVDSAIYYPIPVHKQKPYIRSDTTSYLPVSESFANTVLSLPIAAELSTNEIGYVVDQLLLYKDLYSNID